MKIYSALQIGDYHLNHCEDYLFTGEIGSDKIILAVMDGCTMATDSYFAATMVGKLLRKIALEKAYGEFYGTSNVANIEDLLKLILKDLFAGLQSAKSLLLLDQKELLTTLLIMLIDKNANCGIILAIGDGLVSINGAITEFDHNNKPDYLGFHLAEDFDEWYNSQHQKIAFNNVNDITIATDGIFSFTAIQKVDPNQSINALEFLLTDKTNLENEEMLALKLKTLEHVYGLKPTDDIALIRVIT